MGGRGRRATSAEGQGRVARGRCVCPAVPSGAPLREKGRFAFRGRRAAVALIAHIRLLYLASSPSSSSSSSSSTPIEGLASPGSRRRPRQREEGGPGQSGPHDGAQLSEDVPVRRPEHLRCAYFFFLGLGFVLFCFGLVWFGFARAGTEEAGRRIRIRKGGGGGGGRLDRDGRLHTREAKRAMMKLLSSSLSALGDTPGRKFLPRRHPPLNRSANHSPTGPPCGSRRRTAPPSAPPAAPR